MAYGTPTTRRRPRNIVVGVMYVAFGIIMGTAITFGVRGGLHTFCTCTRFVVSALCDRCGLGAGQSVGGRRLPLASITCCSAAGAQQYIAPSEKTAKPSVSCRLRRTANRGRGGPTSIGSHEPKPTAGLRLVAQERVHGQGGEHAGQPILHACGMCVKTAANACTGSIIAGRRGSIMNSPVLKAW